MELPSNGEDIGRDNLRKGKEPGDTVCSGEHTVVLQPLICKVRNVTEIILWLMRSQEKAFHQYSDMMAQLPTSRILCTDEEWFHQMLCYLPYVYHFFFPCFILPESTCPCHYFGLAPI